MKASLKFRDDQKPLVRAKIPLNILGLPFQSGVVAGNCADLTLNLSTAFHSGPSLRLSYRPNDPANPFSFSVKSGSGPFGSSLSYSISLSANFNLLHHRNATIPNFTLNFSQSLGDFSVKKRILSSEVDPSIWKCGKNVTEVNGGASNDEDPSIEFVENPDRAGGFGMVGCVRRFGDFSRNIVELPTPVAGLLSGMEVRARTEVPIMRRAAVVSFHWGVRVPVEISSSNSSNFSKFPFLVMDKIGIEHIKGHELKEYGNGCKKIDNGVENTDCKLGGASSNAGESWYLMRKQLEMLKVENGEMRKAMDELRCEFASERPERRICNSSKKSSSNASSGYKGKGTEGEVSEELKKALKGGNGA